MRTVPTACAAALLLAAAPAWPGDPERGRAASAVCQACHGPDGNSPVATFPVIAGQYEDYLLHSMLAYQNGARSNPIMVAAMAPLSRTELENLAAYYARQSGLRALDVGAGADPAR